ncbi:MAG: ABC transporter permease [Chloroflexota bacterium]|nr:ABC transporter permease [Chloroflexota bacterium]MDE2958797.1 ABC transporter permease [Chloroflexota bacterium]
MAQVTATDVIVQDAERRTRNWVWAIANFSQRNPVGAISGLAILGIVFVAVFAPYVATHHPTEYADFSALREAPGPAHWMGTDDIGRDLYSRVVHGARISLFVAMVAVLVGDLIGAAWGVASGYIGGRLDIYSQRFLELLMSFPTLILAMILVLAMGAGVWTVIVAISITRIPLSVRVIRSVTLSVKENAYVDAAQAIGASSGRVMVRHIAPQCVAPWLVLATAHLGSVIILEASLGFLGVGVPMPTATWGNMLGGPVAAGLIPRWWMVVFPGLAITVTVLAFNLFGDSIRDALDPKLRGRT